MMNSTNSSSYIMRLWRKDGEAFWRIVLKPIDDGEVRHFAGMDRFIEFLQIQALIDFSEQQRGERNL